MDDDNEIKSKKANKFINKFPKSFHNIYPKKKEVFSGQIVRNYQMNLFIKHILIQIKAKSSLMIVKMIYTLLWKKKKMSLRIKADLLII